MNNTIIIPYKFKKAFDNALANHRILFIAAPPGYGKTVVCRQILANSRQYWLNAADFLSPANLAIPDGTELIIIDDLQSANNTAALAALSNFIEQNTKQQFVLLSRFSLPTPLLKFEISGQLYRLDMNNLHLEAAETIALFAAYNCPLKQESGHYLSYYYHGNPLALHLLAKRGKSNPHNDQGLLNTIKWQVYQYWESIFLTDFSIEACTILYNLSLLNYFTIELAQKISGLKEAQAIIPNLIKNSLFLIPYDHDSYCCPPQLIDFLQWQVKQVLQAQDINRCYNLAGLYYQEHQNYVNAVYYYHQAKNQAKVIEILETCSLLHSSIANFKELEPYYKELSTETIHNSQELLVGMAMLCVLRVDYDGADYWYQILSDQAQIIDPNSKAYHSIQEKLVFLDLACPHREASTIQKTISNLFHGIKMNKLKLHKLSISSCLPTVLNGGRDFSEWAKADDLIYHTMKKPIEHVLAEQGVGLLECGYCESKFEKGLDYHNALIQMMAVLPDIQARGTIDTEFVLLGILARIQISQGKANLAKETLLQFAKRLQPADQSRFLPNIKAMICHIDLCCANYKEAEYWLENESPKELTNIWILWRLQYRIKCEIFIMQNRDQEALILLSQLLNYSEKCHKVLDTINFRTLSAITNYRMGQKIWHDDLNIALDLAVKFGYTTPLAKYGKAVLPLLLSCKWAGSKPHLTKIIKQTRIQASFYQGYLEIGHQGEAKLSNMEQQVLALICQDRSNQEIADILGIQLSTVKTHVSHILRKLQIKRRSEAKTAAKKHHLVEDYLP